MSCSDGFGFLSSSALAVTRKPGVQTPHCRAAPSRKHCCKGCRWPCWAMFSTVSIVAPSASTASTMQLLTGRPFISTVQAPQLPLLQPSLAPVRRTLSRSTSSRLWRASQRNSVAWPLIVVVTWCFLDTAGWEVRGQKSGGAGALSGFGEGAFHEDADKVDAIFLRAAHVGDGRGHLFCQLARLGERFFGGR